MFQVPLMNLTRNKDEHMHSLVLCAELRTHHKVISPKSEPFILVGFVNLSMLRIKIAPAYDIMEGDGEIKKTI